MKAVDRVDLHLPGFRAPFLWLQIKNSAGTSVRNAMAVHYPTPPMPAGEDWHSHQPTFAEVEPIYWNAVLNRYRTELGPLKTKRLLFAREHLYRNFDEIVSFAILREPRERCLSMYAYLNAMADPERSLWDRMLGRNRPRRRHHVPRENFRLFLEAVRVARADPTRDIHFSTHTAQVFEDVSDREGRVLLKRAIRLEDAAHALPAVLGELSDGRLSLELNHLNRSGAGQLEYADLASKESTKLVEELFGPDFELYEKA